MSKVSLIFQGLKKIPKNSFKRSLCLSIYDPPYLESLKPKIPLYDQVNIQMKGYDYAVLESYQKLVHKLATTMDLEVNESWATPAARTKIQKFKPNGTVLDCEYTLTTFERNTQVVDLPTTMVPILIEVLQSALPQGISMCVRLHEEEDDKKRYVPDFELKELKTKLDDLGGPINKRK